MSEWRTNRKTRTKYPIEPYKGLSVDEHLALIRAHPYYTVEGRRYKRGLLLGDTAVLTYYRVVWNPVLGKFVAKRIVEGKSRKGLVNLWMFRDDAEKKAQEMNRMLESTPSASERRNIRRREEAEMDRVYAEKSEHEHDCDEFGCDDRDDDE